MYRIYGDKRILERHYEAMSRWIRYNQMMYPQHIRWNKPQYGDWLSIPAADLIDEMHGNNKYSAFSTTPFEVFGTAYYAYVVNMMRDIADVLGKTEDERKYASLFEEIKATFNREFVEEDARIKGNTQTAYAMALFMNLLPEDKREQAARHLVNRIEIEDWHITTGIHGIRFLLPVLSEYGYDDVAYRLLQQDTYPSWMYTIHEGATTIWERWDGWTEERGFQNTLMNSFNHYALGSVGEWMYRYMGGINPVEPGYKKIVIQPRINERLKKADVSYRCIRGLIASKWEVTERGELDMQVTIPPNAIGEIVIPLKYGSTISESGIMAEQSEGVTLHGRDEENAVYHCEPGTYRFTSRT
jgi:alpha-L-rhamnosidase